MSFTDFQTREDGTIETAVPLPAPFAAGSSGATPFTPGHFIDASPPGMTPESSQSLPLSPSPETGVERVSSPFLPWT